MRPNNSELDKLLGVRTPVLDKGFVQLVDYMGGDDAIVQAARVSYGQGTETPSKDAALINYLLEHRHTTPFEMCEIKLHVKLPIFVARQWIRHRTANVNEYSARYSVMHDEFYFPDPEQIQTQSKSNKQGRDGHLNEDEIRSFQEGLEVITGGAWVEYQKALDNGVTREVARMLLPINIYTSWYWKIDLHNLMHFLALRCDPHAQWEIRQYADLILSIMRLWVPAAAQSFEKHVLGGVRLSSDALNVIRVMIFNNTRGAFPGGTVDRNIDDLKGAFSKRQWNALMELFDRELMS